MVRDSEQDIPPGLYH